MAAATDDPARASVSLSVIVPVYNESYLVEASLARLAVLRDSPLLRAIKVIVVDDGSDERTAAAISRFRDSLGATCSDGKLQWIYLRHQQNQGKGAAVRTALEYADTDLTVIHDADLEYHPADLPKMVHLFLHEDADAVFGSRFLSGEYRRALLFRHALGNRLLTLLCNAVSDLYLTDMETCYKMVRTRLLKSIPLESRDFRIEPELAIKLAKRGARIFEVPISYSGRTYQEGKKINWKDGVRALWSILAFGISDHIYSGDEFGGEILARLGRAPRFMRWMADVVRPYVGDRVLEVGAGTGNLTLNLTPRSVYWATDVNQEYLSRLRELCETRPYLKVQYADVTRPEALPSNQNFDTVICMNVLEHLQDDVAALSNLRDALEEGGRAVVLVPCGPRVYGSLDKVLGHYRRYTREQLIAVGQQAGLRPEKMLAFNRAGWAGWWVNGRLLRRKTFSLWQMKLLNSLTPFSRAVDRWLPLPPLSLIAIFRKETTGEPATSGTRPGGE